MAFRKTCIKCISIKIFILYIYIQVAQLPAAVLLAYM